jgi:uncharacterized protein YbjT (DUF2867 family)
MARGTVASGLEWVILQTGFPATTTRAMWVGQLRAGDVVRGSFAEWRAAPVHEINVAAVVARALLTDGLLGQTIVLTGPHSLTQPEMVAAIAAAMGRSLRFRELPPDAAREDMIVRGFDPGFVDALLAAQAEKADRRRSSPSSRVRRLGQRGVVLGSGGAALSGG